MLTKELTNNKLVVLFPPLIPSRMRNRLTTLPTAQSHLVAFNGEVTDSAYSRITAEIASLEIRIRHNLSKPLLSGLGSLVEYAGYDSEGYNVAIRLLDQLPEAGEQYADYFAAAKQEILQPNRIEHHDPRPLLTRDGETYIEPRQTYTRMLFSVNPDTPDRQIVVSAAVALPEHVQSLYRDWYDQLDLPSLSFGVKEIEEEARRIQQEEQSK